VPAFIANIFAAALTELTNHNGTGKTCYQSVYFNDISMELTEVFAV
jgi:hypothetical protein